MSGSVSGKDCIAWMEFFNFPVVLGLGDSPDDYVNLFLVLMFMEADAVTGSKGKFCAKSGLGFQFGSGSQKCSILTLPLPPRIFSRNSHFNSPDLLIILHPFTLSLFSCGKKRLCSLFSEPDTGVQSP